jgi:hypothetical protein
MPGENVDPRVRTPRTAWSRPRWRREPSAEAPPARPAPHEGLCASGSRRRRGWRGAPMRRSARNLPFRGDSGGLAVSLRAPRSGREFPGHSSPRAWRKIGDVRCEHHGARVFDYRFLPRRNLLRHTALMALLAPVLRKRAAHAQGTSPPRLILLFPQRPDERDRVGQEYGERIHPARLVQAARAPQGGRHLPLAPGGHGRPFMGGISGL